MKKICLILSLLTALHTVVTLPAGAANTTKGFEDFISVSSNEFPNAYIITEYYDAEDIIINSSTGKLSTTGMTSPNIELLQAISSEEELVGFINATVFVEQEYATITREGTEELIITNSRLLSKEEVDSIGIENFTSTHAVASSNYSDDTTASRDKLYLTFAITEVSINEYDVAYNLTGTASWSGMHFIPYLNGDTSPAVGDDFMGFTWGGEFDYSNNSASATLEPIGDTEISLCSAVPNAGLVWSCLELQYSHMMGYNYLSFASLGTQLRKKTLTGDGNTTAAVFKYIHTYEDHDVSPSISYDFGEGALTADFSLSSVEKQWSLVCTLSGLEY